MLPTVWIGRATLEDADAALERALRVVHPPRPAPVRTVAIKINLCDYRRPESGAVTDPRILRGLVLALRERFPSAEIVVAENDATTLDADVAFRLLGFDRLAKEMELRLLNLRYDEWRPCVVPRGLHFQQLELPATLLDADLVVNFTKLKTNTLTKVTGCLKNYYALLKLRRKVSLHGRVDPVIVDINKVVRSDLCVIDGIIGMEGMGPAFGKPRRCNLLLVGSNPVAADACAARLMGFWPRGVRHLRLAERAGLGPLRYRLETDVPDFRYDTYRFEFDRVEYHLRNILRTRAGVAT